MQHEYPYQPISSWWKELTDVHPHLTGEQRCDVAVIGGGYTGLSTAINLRKAGVDVVVLDAAICGSGSSGRNAGHLTPTIGKDMPSLLKVFGREKAGALIRFAESAVRYTEACIHEWQLDCDYLANGNVMTAVHPKQEAALRRSARIAMELGVDVEYLEIDEMKNRRIPGSFISGALDKVGGVLHPGKLVRGLRNKAAEVGVRIFENSRVLEIEEGRQLRISTEEGVVTAERAVLATNAYTPSLGRIKRKTAPVIVTLLETDVLNAAHQEILNWKQREGIYTAHEILESYHYTARGTIVAGSKQIIIPFGSKLKSTNQPGLFNRTTAAFRDRFPQLYDLEIKNYWGGYLAFTTDFLPVTGTTGQHSNIHYGIGFAGHGVAQAIYMGSVLKCAIMGEEHPALSLLDRKTFPWPPEPFRWAGGQLIRGVLTLIDKRLDRKIRKMDND